MSLPGWSPGSLPPSGPVCRPRASLRVGQRARKLGTTGQTGVVRFVGEVDGRPGVWVGVEWDELGLGDTSGELHGRRYFTCSLRGQKVGNAASFLRESELFVSEHMARAENTPLVVAPGEDVYDWSVRPRNSRVFDFLMLMRNFSCCGARCILPDDEEEDTGGALSGALSRGDLLRMARDASVYLGAVPEEPAPGAELRPMRAPALIRPRFTADEED